MWKGTAAIGGLVRGRGRGRGDSRRQRTSWLKMRLERRLRQGSECREYQMKPTPPTHEEMAVHVRPAFGYWNPLQTGRSLGALNGGSGSGMRMELAMVVGFRMGMSAVARGGKPVRRLLPATLGCIFGPKLLLLLRLQLQTNCCTSIKQQSPPSAATPHFGCFVFFLFLFYFTLWLLQGSKLVLAHKSQETC